MILSTENLRIGYDGHTVQTNLDLELKRGEIVCMLGQNGCGKSTLLKTIAGLIPALDGDIFIHEGDERQSLLSLNATERARHIALVLTERESMDNTRVKDIVGMGRLPYTNFLGHMQQRDKEAVEAAMKGVDLEEKKDSFFNCLSDGEKQRVLIAKALAQDTPLILLDEPTAHLDLGNRIRTMLLLRKMAHEQQKGVIISTHELDLALQTADQIWLMTAEQGVLIGTPEQLLQLNAFQKAFEDEHFCLIADNGHLKVEIDK